MAERELIILIASMVLLVFVSGYLGHILGEMSARNEIRKCGYGVIFLFWKRPGDHRYLITEYRLED